MAENPYESPSTKSQAADQSRSGSKAVLVSLILSCVPLASVVGGVTFAVTAANVNGFGDSTLMLAAYGGLATGSLASFATWMWRRRLVSNHGLWLRDLRVSDLLLGALTALLISPFAATAGFAMLPPIALIVPEIETPWGETIAEGIVFSLPAALFFGLVLSGMQGTLEWRLMRRVALRSKDGASTTNCTNL